MKKLLAALALLATSTQSVGMTVEQYQELNFNRSPGDRLALYFTGLADSMNHISLVSAVGSTQSFCYDDNFSGNEMEEYAKDLIRNVPNVHPKTRIVSLIYVGLSVTYPCN